jgi:hypothetical protein
MDTYNYPSFGAGNDVEEFLAFPDIVKVGTRAPDPELVDLETCETVRLSDYTKRGITVVEFGSLT